MVITSSAVFYLLSKKHNISILGNDPNNIPLKTPRILYNDNISSGHMYVSNKGNLENIDLSKKSAYIFCNMDENILPSSLSNLDCAIYHGQLNEFELLDEIFNIFQELQIWDCKLKDAETKHLEISEVLKFGHELFGLPLVMIDKDFTVNAYTADYFNHDNIDMNEKVPLIEIQELITDEEYIIAENRKDVFVYPSYPYKIKHLCYNIFNGSLFVSRLNMLFDGERSTYSGEKYLFEYFGRCISRIYAYLTEDTLMKKQNDTLHYLSKQLLFFQPRGTTLKKIQLILNDYGWEDDNEYTVVVIQFTDYVKFKMLSLYLCQQLETMWQHTCSIKDDTRIIWILNTSLNKNNSMNNNFIKSLSNIIGDFMCKIGISNNFKGFSNLKAYLVQAETALILGQKKNPDFWYYSFNEYIVDYIVSQIVLEFTNEQICHEGLLKLCEYDNKNNTEYVKTLYYYIINKFNVSVAAEKLFVHRSTFIRRLERIEDIAGIKIDNMEELIYLMISLKLIGY